MTKYGKNGTKKIKVPITKDDLEKLARCSLSRFHKAVANRPDSPMYKVHHGQKEVAIALCQSAAMNYHKGETAYGDFDVFLFYDKSKPHCMSSRHPACRGTRKWCYENPKYPRGNIQVDVLVRRIEVCGKNPAEIIRHFLQTKPSVSAHYLAKDAVVLLDPPEELGKVIWYKGSPVD